MEKEYTSIRIERMERIKLNRIKGSKNLKNFGEVIKLLLENYGNDY